MDIVKTMKLLIHVDEHDIPKLEKLTVQYADACAYISQYVFGHEFIVNNPRP